MRRSGAARVVLAWGLLGCALRCALGCSDEPGSRPIEEPCRQDERRGPDGRCGYATPVAVIRYANQAPRSPADYAFGLDARPTLSASAGSMLYLSAESSFGLGDESLGTTWSVLDPSGQSVELVPSDTSPRASFVALHRGEYSVALEVYPVDEPARTGSAELHINIEAWRCAADGISTPCAAADPVVGGRFSMGSTRGGASEQPEHEASVGDFALDRFEVTVGRFRRFFAAYAGAAPAEGAGAHPRISGSGWRPEYSLALPVSSQQLELAFKDCGGSWYSLAAQREALPINCVSWYEAFAFCVWDGGRLPTEAEWEYAAAGGAEGRRYPWGDSEPAAQLAVFGCLFDAGPACTESDLPAGGNTPRGAGRFGQQDLAGSLWEWTVDQFAAYAPGPCSDCAVLDGGEGRVFRGGGFRSDDPEELRAAHRLGFLAEQRDLARGFRCARALARQ